MAPFMTQTMRVTIALPKTLQVDLLREAAVLSVPSSYVPLIEDGRTRTAEDGKGRKRWLARL